jgi:hypothetical protein
MVYLADLGMAAWLKMKSYRFSVFSKERVLSIIAIVILLLGILQTFFRLNKAAASQLEYTRKDKNFEQLIVALNQQNRNYAIVTSDRYLNRILPGYVSQRFLVPVWNDPMTDKQLGMLEDASARLLGWSSWEEMNRELYGSGTKRQEIPQDEKLSFDSKRVIVILNLRLRNRINWQPSNVILRNDDFVVGFIDRQ